MGSFQTEGNATQSLHLSVLSILRIRTSPKQHLWYLQHPLEDLPDSAPYHDIIFNLLPLLRRTPVRLTAGWSSVSVPVVTQMGLGKWVTPAFKFNNILLVLTIPNQ